MGQLSRLVLVIGPLWCLWVIGNPVRDSRASIGDAAGPLLCAMFLLAAAGLARRWHADESSANRDQGRCRDRSRSWMPVLAVVLLAVLSNGSLLEPNPWILFPGLAFVAYVFTREDIRPRSAKAERGLLLVAAAALTVDVWFTLVVALGLVEVPPAEAPLGATILLGLFAILVWKRVLLTTSAARSLDDRWLQIALVYPVCFAIGCFVYPAGELSPRWPFWREAVFFAPLILLACSPLARTFGRKALEVRAVFPASRRAFDHPEAILSPAFVVLFLSMLPPPEPLQPQYSNDASYSGVLFFGLFLWGTIASIRWVGRWVVSVFGASSASTGVNVVLRSIRPVHVLLALGVGATFDSFWFVLATMLFLGVAVAREEALSFRGAQVRPGPTVARVIFGLLPLLTPALAFVVIRHLDPPNAWRAVLATRGQIALVVETLPVPLLGAALLVAWQLDVLRTGRASSLPAWIGVLLLVACAANVALVPDFGQRWVIAPAGASPFLADAIERSLPAEELYGAGACLVLAAALYTIFRLRVLDRSAGVRAWIPPIVLAGAHAALAAAWVPRHGPVAALWAGVVSVVVALVVEWALVARFAPRYV